MTISGSSDMNSMKLQEESESLKEQPALASKEALNARSELQHTQENMQREFASLWMAVQELNKLDAVKLLREKTSLLNQAEADLRNQQFDSTTEDRLRNELATVSAERDSLLQLSEQQNQALLLQSVATVRSINENAGVAATSLRTN